MPRAPLNQTHHIPESPKGPTVMQAHRLYTFLLSGRGTYHETLEGSRDCEGEFQ